MALSKSVSFSPVGLSQVVTVQAYIKVIKVEGGKSGVKATIGVFESQAAMTPIWEDRAEFVPVMGGPDFLAQAYQAMKGLPEYADAVDC